MKKDFFLNDNHLNKFTVGIDKIVSIFKFRGFKFLSDVYDGKY